MLSVAVAIIEPLSQFHHLQSPGTYQNGNKPWFIQGLYFNMKAILNPKQTPEVLYRLSFNLWKLLDLLSTSFRASCYFQHQEAEHMDRVTESGMQDARLIELNFGLWLATNKFRFSYKISTTYNTFLKNKMTTNCPNTIRSVHCIRSQSSTFAGGKAPGNIRSLCCHWHKLFFSPLWCVLPTIAVPLAELFRKISGSHCLIYQWRFERDYSSNIEIGSHP